MGTRALHALHITVSVTALTGTGSQQDAQLVRNVISSVPIRETPGGSVAEVVNDGDTLRIQPRTMRHSVLTLCLACVACGSGGGTGATSGGGSAGTGGGVSGSGGTGGSAVGGTSSGGASGSGGSATGGAGGGISTQAEELVTAIQITSFALDATSIYFTATDLSGVGQEHFGVYRVAKTGGAAEELTLGDFETMAVAVDGPNVYYVTHDKTAEKATLYRVTAGNTPVSVDEIPFVPYEGPGHETVVAKGWVYWAGNSALRRVPTSGGAGEWMGGAGLDAIAVDDTHAYTLASGGFEPTGSVLATTLGGDEYQPLAESLPRPMDMAIDDTSVYLVMLGETTQQTDGSVVSLPKTGGTTTPLVSNVPGMLTIAVDAVDVYYSAADAQIHRVSKSGGSPSTVTEAKTLPRGLELDETHVYWHDSFTIYRAQR